MAIRRNPPNEPANAANTHGYEPREIPAMERSPAERPHHEPVEHPTNVPRIEPAARDPEATHKERVRHEHDSYWRKAKK